MRTLSRRIRFAFRDRFLFIESFAIVFLTTAAMRITSFRSLERLMPATGDGTAPPSFEFRLARSIANAARFVPGATCLRQALAAQFMLARRGFGSTIEVGVALDPSQALNAHAWLMSGDQIITGGSAIEIARYARIERNKRLGR